MLKYIIIVKLILYVSILAAQINYHEFATRRSNLMDSLKVGVVIMNGANELMRNNDIEYNFRQNSNFYYLSGFEEQGASLVLLPEEKKFVMFVKKFDPKMALWLGETYGINRTKEIFKADIVIPVDSFEVSLKKYLQNQQKIYLLDKDSELNELIHKIVKTDTVQYPGKITNLKSHLDAMRLIKSTYETEMLQKAIDITTDALQASYKFVEPGKFEYEVNALINYIYLKSNSPRVGFPSIVASGPNATILHYRKYDRQMENGDLVLLDIGAEYGMYSADISRTIPVNGRFSDKQREIYQIVLDAQKAGILACKPGVGIREISAISTNIIKEGLYELGLITDKNSKWQTHVWFMHGVSHWLGLDTHDSGTYGPRDEKGKILEPGMVLTVEPGIYISQLAFDSFDSMFGAMVPKEEIEAFRNAVRPAFEKYEDIGVRIEDDILITKYGNENLSEKTIKEINDIEKMMAE